MPKQTQGDLILSEEQAAAVESSARALILVAGAGSGKTEVVARRIQRLLAEDPTGEGRILGLTYTVKAAEELRTRIRSRVGAPSKRVRTDTLHGFAHELVRLHGTRIGLPVEPEVLTRDEDRAVVLEEWLEGRGLETPGDVQNAFTELDLLRARGQTSPLLSEWEDALAASGALDFPALLVAAESLLQNPSTKRQIHRLYTHVVVDEAQNLTPAQFRLLEALACDMTGQLEVPTMLVGDDKQSIVSFAGADPGLMEVFASRYGAVRLQLARNFRSAASIAIVTGRVAEVLGHPNEPLHYAAPGIVARHDAVDEREEAMAVGRWVLQLLNDGIPPAALAENESPVVRPEEIAILARSAAALRQTATALEALGVNHGTASNPRDWLTSRPGRIALELVSLRSMPDHKSTHWELSRLLGVDPAEVTSPEALETVLQQRSEGSLNMLSCLCRIDDVSAFVGTLSQLELPMDSEEAELAAWEGDVGQFKDAWQSFVDMHDWSSINWGAFRLFCLKQQRGEDYIDGVRLLTIHKAQGREYKAVALVGLNDGQLPDFRAQTEDERRAELRTFYVAASRAQRVLLLSRPMTRETRYGPRAAVPSPYLRFAEGIE